jgi:hypothetical protein
MFTEYACSTKNIVEKIRKNDEVQQRCCFQKDVTIRSHVTSALDVLKQLMMSSVSSVWMNSDREIPVIDVKYLGDIRMMVCALPRIRTHDLWIQIRVC